MLVAAHTSAGKTVVAEYAVALSLRGGQRVIYTSPIKALSNQKYRELAAEFGGDSVGLMTGDVTLNPNASCLVMTTEILRAMIYKGSELLREVAWVVFDEVHYMQDRERGVVWEETIIFLPRAARMVFLSATLSNAAEFAAWVAHLHKRPCHVVYTEYRPTPLQHFVMPLVSTGDGGLYLAKSAAGEFKPGALASVKEAFEAAAAAKEGGGGGGGKRGKKGGGGGGGGGGEQSATGASAAGGGGGGDAADAAANAPFKLTGAAKRSEDQAAIKAAVAQLAKSMHSGRVADWLPVIFFSFSKRETEAYAGVVYRKGRKGCVGLCFTSAEEQAVIDAVFDNAVACLSDEDRALPAITELRAMLRAGVGVHHGGLLPLMKEVVELLFQDGFVKLLFTTETFAMGLNMPARSVVFTGLTKWDGSETRLVTSGEYIQMSGRAGRRNKDARGNVAVLAGPDFTEEAARAVMMGAAKPLVSSFRLSYYTLLNLMRRPEAGTADLEVVVRNSFSQFQRDRAAPKVRCFFVCLCVWGALPC